MRYALLDLVACQQCHAPLTSFTAREIASEMPQVLLPGASRVSAGPGVGPVLARSGTPLAALLERHARAASDPARNFGVEIEEGLLICPDCGRWYPIIGQLPEILPDHLRDAARDLAWFAGIRDQLPDDLRGALAAFAPGGAADHDAGTHYKTSEMSIASKIDDPHFFGPGYSSPFNPWNPEFTLYLIGLFGGILPVLELRKGETLVDSGCGYAWTTEWFHRAGIPAVGVDISRVYPEIGIKRMGPSRPHLVIGDVEHLPLQDAAADAILAYESFHHLPDRARAMASYDRVLRPRGRVVLAEPGAAHDAADQSVDAMRKYGILEHGMELDDVRAYARATRLASVEQIHLPRLIDADFGREIHPDFIRSRLILPTHLFRLTRGDAASSFPAVPAPRPRLADVLKRKARGARRRLGLGR